MIFLDYYLIGQQIRKYRKALGISQEQLAETVGISVTHMSHIETANTKLSLPVFVDIAKALGVQTDELLGGASDRGIIIDELYDVMEGCTTAQLRIIVDVAKATKAALKKYDTP